MCFDLNEILIEEKMFLMVYELKDKFRYLFHEDKEKKEVIRRISSCIKEKFNGFHVAVPSLSKGQKKRFKSHKYYLYSCKITGRCNPLFFLQMI